jgi:hypothetical protein
MAEINEDTTVEIPLRNLVALGVGLVMATTAYITLDTRITTVEHGIEIQGLTVQENAEFVREWPLGLRGALPDDLIQNAKIMALENQQEEILALRQHLNTIEIKLSRLDGTTETQEDKIETLFQLWNSQNK